VASDFSPSWAKAFLSFNWATGRALDGCCTGRTGAVDDRAGCGQKRSMPAVRESGWSRHPRWITRRNRWRTRATNSPRFRYEFTAP
jgi:hypothetical protein